MSENTVTVVGNVTREPEMRFTPAGAGVVGFGIAVNRRKFNKATNDYEESTSFFNVNAWQSLAENVAETVTKGMRVVVVGRLEQRSWETDAGEKRSVVEIVADEVAPSLRWASAVVTKNERSEGGARRSAPAPDDDQPF